MNNSVRAKKYLGQHFLKDERIAKQIAETYTQYIDPCVLPNLLEIGPGMGVLTKYLIAAEKSEKKGCENGNSTGQRIENESGGKNKSIGENSLKESDEQNGCASIKSTIQGNENKANIGGREKNFNVKVIEIDVESVVFLEKKYPDLCIVEGDFLHFPLSEIFEGSFGIIGNFPYNISSQILFRTLENRNRIPCLVGMFQKEVAMRVAAGPGSKTYGILSVLLQAFYDIDYIFTVPPTVFNPPPQVESGVIRMQRNQTEHLDCDEKLFITVVKTAFNQRRKTLRNALKPLLTNTSEPITGSIFDKRAEQLSVQDFVEITKLIAL